MNKYVYFDIETTIAGVDGIDHPWPVCIAIGRSDRDKIKLYSATRFYHIPSWIDRLIKHCIKSGSVLVAHNIVFDLGLCLFLRPDMWRIIYKAAELCLLYCTMIKKQLIDISRTGTGHPKSLTASLQEYTSQPVHEKLKSVTKRALLSMRDSLFEIKPDINTVRFCFYRVLLMPHKEYPEIFIEYATKDIQYLKMLHQALECEDTKERKNSHILHILSGIAVSNTAYQGVCLRQDYLLNLTEVTKLSIQKYAKHIERHGWIRASKMPGEYIKSTKIIKKYIENVLPEAKIDRTPKGDVSINETNVKRLKLTGDKVATAYVEYCSLTHKFDSFIRPLIDNKGVVYFSYNPLVNSGRMSSKK